ncbi:hypothetical protein XA68_13207 [Ophiocordyceps unilateralis]|uniref:Uncharacterized protein n=1 Tax=Ophiocordyceps unilateralis TaxID=268505 RepID=A0A2A9PCQ5_OPHUN|nr:hypothetical protein XA68_13207 [Ophiocordyceps unilateralis]
MYKNPQICGLSMVRCTTDDQCCSGRCLRVKQPPPNLGPAGGFCAPLTPVNGDPREDQGIASSGSSAVP